LDLNLFIHHSLFIYLFIYKHRIHHSYYKLTKYQHQKERKKKEILLFA